MRSLISAIFLIAMVTFSVSTVSYAQDLFQWGTVLEYFTPEPTCTDSDSGINYYQKGTTSGLDSDGNRVTKVDSCYDHAIGDFVPSCEGGHCNLMEYYCGTDGNVREDMDWFKYFIHLGQKCNDGKSVIAQLEIEEEKQVLPQIYDSPELLSSSDTVSSELLKKSGKQFIGDFLLFVANPSEETEAFILKNLSLLATNFQCRDYSKLPSWWRPLYQESESSIKETGVIAMAGTRKLSCELDPKEIVGTNDCSNSFAPFQKFWALAQDYDWAWHEVITDAYFFVFCSFLRNVELKNLDSDRRVIEQAPSTIDPDLLSR